MWTTATAAVCAVSVAGVQPPNLTTALRADRLQAEELWRRGEGLLWFQHYRRAGGTSLCQLLREVPQATFLLARSEACQPEDWKLRDAVAVCEHNLTLVGEELRVQDANAFAQEYGSVPGRHLVGHRVQRHRLRHWVFVATLREPWSRFWSQLRYELATCLMDATALTACIGGNFESLGNWWSPTAHRDTVLGVAGNESTWTTPRLYVDNYYTRVLLNKTDFDEWPRLAPHDMKFALALLRERFSAVIIAEDFRISALQLACALDLNIDKAKAKLGVKIRPYSEHAALMEVPEDESRLGKRNVDALRSRFVQKNSFDYALYAEARKLSKRRVHECARRRPDVEAVRRSPPPIIEPPKALAPKAGDALPPPIGVDDLFGCSGGNLEFDEKRGQYMLYCPRSAEQHATSWWSSERNIGPKRKKGQRALGWECWKNGFSWASCCESSFGPKGNQECWDEDFTHTRCCVAE